MQRKVLRDSSLCVYSSLCRFGGTKLFQCLKQRTTSDELERARHGVSENGLYIKNQFQNAFRSWWFDVRSLEPEQKTIRINRTNGLGAVKCVHNLYLFSENCVFGVFGVVMSTLCTVFHSFNMHWRMREYIEFHIATVCSVHKSTYTMYSVNSHQILVYF